ncbi:MAG: 6-phosphogluconolactonase [Polyangiaceae bacterium]|nr:6-phosphogluconolactonase [Polyangiaceae bacterium]
MAPRIATIGPRKVHVEIYETAADVADAAAATIADLAKPSGERASVMLAGGTTPKIAYERLAKLPVDFARIDFYFGDERAVPPDHADSNYRMARSALFDPAHVGNARVRRMAGELADLESAARDYEALLPKRVDLLLLGMGEDGHTASLFPGSSAIGETSRLVLPVIGPKPPPKRLTITPPVIERAALVLVLATGASKADALTRALQGPWDPSAVPIQLASGPDAESGARARFLLDRDAAAKLVVN